jgi:hypothetical protein
MHLLQRTPLYPAAVPLRNAVLCVECESVSSSRVDKCPVCGSSSLLSIAPMLGGTLADLKARESRNDKFNLAIHVVLEDIEGRDVNAAISVITELVEVRAGAGRASVHFDVEPVVNECIDSEPKVA